MVKSGDRMSSPLTGEHFVFVQTAADSDGKLLVIDCTMSPGSRRNTPLHFHPLQEERVYIKQGRGRFLLNGHEWLLGPGETVIIPRGMVHTWSNASNCEDLIVRREMEPALHWDELIESLCVGSHAGMISAEGRVQPLFMGTLLHHFKDHLYMAGRPMWLQKAANRVFSAIGRILGYRPQYHYFRNEGSAMMESIPAK